MFGAMICWQGFTLIRSFGLFGLLHFSQLIYKFLNEGNVKTLSQQLQNLSKHVEERRSELFEIELQAYKDWPKDVLQLLIVLNQIFRVLFPGKQLS
jgi:hypothetical protein